MRLTAQQKRTLACLVDCIIPADDYPAASENGVIDYIERLLDTDLKHHNDQVQCGLALLDDEAMAIHGKPFADLDEPTKIALLRAVESGQDLHAGWTIPPGQFFELMITVTHEGYYTDPGNGSNRQGASWKMIGYDPRVPEPVKEKWLEGLP
jgi:hypothetical protein